MQILLFSIACLLSGIYLKDVTIQLERDKSPGFVVVGVWTFSLLAGFVGMAALVVSVFVG